MTLKQLSPSERLSLIGGQLAGTFQQFQDQAGQGAAGFDFKGLGKLLGRVIDLIEESEPLVPTVVK